VTYTQHGSFFQHGKMKITNDLYAQVHLKSEPLAVYTQHGSFFQYGKMKITNDLYAQVHLKSEPLAV
jgi:hypothetical protein